MRRCCSVLATGVTGLRLHFSDPLKAPALVREAALSLGGPGYYVNDWTQDHANFFRSIEITKSMMFLILLMIVAVAAFNIVATLVMIVKEKQTDIAILRTLGAGPRNVLLMFAIQGVLIGLAGTLLGAALGTLVADNLQTLVGALEHLHGHAVPRCARLLHERAARLRGARRCPQGVRGGIPAVRAGDDLPGVARGAHRPCGGPAA